MAVLKEWRCAIHGDFDSTHPLCPNFGCESEQVERIFKTPVGTRSDATRRFDAGIRKSADMMGISNFKSAKGGDTSFAGRAAEENETIGSRVLWGDEIAKPVNQGGLGVPFNQLTMQAQQPLVVNRADGSQVSLTSNNAMAEAATEMGVTARRIPKAAEISVASGDSTSLTTMRAKA